MIDEIIADAIDMILRENIGEISTQTIKRKLHSLNIGTANFDFLSHLKSHPLLFETGINSFVSRASVYTNKYFSIKPTKTEIAQGILIPGHRCMPFVDPEMYPYELQFVHESISLSKKTLEISIADIMDTHFLYGEEYIPQLLAVDPANKDYDFVKHDYIIPNIVRTTAWDMKDAYSKNNFVYGDRLLARVINWNKGVIEVKVEKTLRSTPFEVTDDDEQRGQWFKIFDNALLSTISKYGPLASIEEQLAYTFFLSSGDLCTKFCCSTEEYMTQEHSVCIEYYGVESRLWKKGEEIPAVGSWNESIKDMDELVNTLYDEIGIPIPFYMLDAYIFDALFRKEKGLVGIYERMIPDKTLLDDDQTENFMLHIRDRYDKLVKKYNRFLDFEKGKVRSISLELYSSLVKLICELDSCGIPVASLPQQQLVIVSQLFSHTTKFLEAFMTETNLSKDDIVMISTSLDGMIESFDEVSTDLTRAMGTKNIDGFTII